MTDEPSEYEKATRWIALLAMGDAIAAGMIASACLPVLIESGNFPRDSAVEVVDACMLKIEEIRATVPAFAADRARDKLGALMERIRSLSPPPAA
jgi:hypothetical protein